MYNTCRNVYMFSFINIYNKQGRDRVNDQYKISCKRRPYRRSRTYRVFFVVTAYMRTSKAQISIGRPLKTTEALFGLFDSLGFLRESCHALDHGGM